MSDKNRPTDAEATRERESLEVAEAAREQEWKQPSFMKEMFLGNFRLDLIHPYPEDQERPEFVEFRARFEEFLREHVDVDRGVLG